MYNTIDSIVSRDYLRVFYSRIDLESNDYMVMGKERECNTFNTIDCIVSVKEFRQRLASAIVPYEEKLRTPNSTPTPSALRYSTGNHWPGVGKRGRCKFCQKKTTTTCEKCEVNICSSATGRKCFKSYHST